MSVLAYFQAILPLTLAQLAVPPLSTFELMRRELPPESVEWLIESIRAITPKDMKTKEFVHSLLLPNIDYNSFLEKPERLLNYRMITSLFVHYDYQHLLGNLMMLLAYDMPLYQEKGIIFFYNIYFAGGLLCVLPLYPIISDRYHTRGRQPQSPIRFIQGFFQDTLDSLQPQSPTRPDVVHCGSSTAISAILGGSSVVLAKHLSLSLIKIFQLIQESSRDKDISDAFMREAVECCVVSWGLWQAYKFIQVELSGVQRQSRSFSFEFSRLFDPSSWKVTNHEAHLQGFVIGAMITLTSYQS